MNHHRDYEDLLSALSDEHVEPMLIDILTQVDVTRFQAAQANCEVMAGGGRALYGADRAIRLRLNTAIV